MTEEERAFPGPTKLWHLEATIAAVAIILALLVGVAMAHQMVGG